MPAINCREADASPRVAAPVLRDYQRAAVRCVVAGFARGVTRAYFSIPTGSGKTLVLATVARERLPLGRCLVVVHRSEIAEQLRRTISDVCGARVGFIGGGRCEEPEAAIVVALVQSLRGKGLERVMRDSSFAALLIDEAHHVAPGNSYAKLVATLAALSPDLAVLGATATPYRTGNERMQDVLTTCVFDRSIDDMVKSGVLAPLRHVPLDVKLDLRRLKKSKGDYAQSDLAAAMTDPVVAATVRLSEPHIEGRRTIAFAVSCDHASALRNEYERRGTRAWLVYGDMPTRDRTEALAAWRREVGVLVNVDIASEGFDECSVSAIVQAAPTQSPGRYVQRVGRGTRKAPGKIDCVVLDVTGGAARHDERQVLFESVFLRPDTVGRPSCTSQRAKGRRLMARPEDDGRNAWITVREDTYAMSVGDGGLWTVQRSQDGSGLWCGTLFARRDVVERHDGLPCAEVLERVHRCIRAKGANDLTSRDAPWLDDPATEPTLRYIASFDRAMAFTARAQRWNKRQANAYITRMQALRTLSAQRETYGARG